MSNADRPERDDPGRRVVALGERTQRQARRHHHRRGRDHPPDRPRVLQRRADDLGDRPADRQRRTQKSRPPPASDAPAADRTAARRCRPSRRPSAAPWSGRSTSTVRGRNTLGGNTAACIRQSTTTKQSDQHDAGGEQPGGRDDVVRDLRDADRQRGGTDQQQRPHRDPQRRCRGARARPGRRAARSAPAWPSAPSGSPSRPNAHRHNPNCANRPPIAGPTTVATPHIADTSAEARVHSERGSAALMTA